MVLALQICFFYLFIISLGAIISDKSQYMEMILEGIACIAEGENPRVIENKLQGYVGPN